MLMQTDYIIQRLKVLSTETGINVNFVYCLILFDHYNIISKSFTAYTLAQLIIQHSYGLPTRKIVQGIFRRHHEINPQYS